MRYTVFWSAFSILCLSMCLMIGSLFFAAKKGNEEILPQQAKIETEVTKEKKSETNFEYILKENSGKLSVYKGTQTEPIETFNVYINTLPAYDQKELKSGILVKDYEELLTLIEDYIS